MKLNADALLRLDPASRTSLMREQIDAWLLTPDEGRLLEDRPPLTDDDIDLLKSRTTKPSEGGGDDG